MTARTSIERAAEAVRNVNIANGGADIPWSLSSEWGKAFDRHIARAALEAALSDREGLAFVIAEADMSWQAKRGVVEQDPFDVTLADAIIAYLTGGES